MKIRAAVLVWALAAVAGAQTTIRPGGGGGSSIITSGTTATSGCTDGAFLYSLTSLIRCGSLMVTDGTNVITASIAGSSAVNGDITINGTTSATKTTSYVLLQDTGGYVGIGHTAPTAALHLKGAGGNATAPISILESTSSSAFQQIKAFSGAAGTYYLSGATPWYAGLGVYTGGTGYEIANGLGPLFSIATTGATTIGSSSLGTSVVPLTVTPGTGSTANIQNWTNSAGTVLATVEKNGYFGIGTSAPIVQFQVHTSADKNIALYDYAGSPTIITMNDAGSVLLPMNLRASSFVFLTGSPVWGSVAPAVSNTSANSCGTTAATIAGTAETGIVTVGATSGTSCTVTFAVAAPTRRQCVVTNETTGVAVKATYSSTTVSLFAGTFAASDVLAYICQVY